MPGNLWRSNRRRIKVLRTAFVAAVFATLIGPQSIRCAPPDSRPESSKPKSFEGNKPEVVRPTDDGAFLLPASKCEVYGTTLEYMKPDRALGWWNSADDRAVWTIEGAMAGRYEVWFEWSCDDESAGNTFLLEIGKHRLTGKIPSTKAWEKHDRARFGAIELPTGKAKVEIRAEGKIKEALCDLREVRLVPVK